MRVTVWNEFEHEKTMPNVQAIYPRGIHAVIADFVGKAGHTVRTATLNDPECGLTEEVLADTDVLFWWGHCRHNDVPDDVVERVARHVYEGMGLVVLHSGHMSKIFRRLVGTPGRLKWRESGDKEVLWVVEQGHPITDGIGENIILEQEETYGEHFNIPAPDELLLISWFSGGEVCRSGCIFKRGRGKIFYFRPGHETVPTYHNLQVQQLLLNSIPYITTPRKNDYGYGQVPPVVQ